MMLSWAGLIMLAGIVGVAALVATVVYTLRRLRRKAAAAGYSSSLEYLRAVPRNDVEKRQAVDLALKGLVLCVLGLFFPPLLLVGVIPFYYGARKLILVWLGLDILDEADRSRA